MNQPPNDDLAIARGRTLQPINNILDELAVPERYRECYGTTKAKIDPAFVGPVRPESRLVLVSGINPTPAGEGKTTVAIGLTQGLKRAGKGAVVALREPSLGPCMGMKGGATGGGYSQVLPMEDINLHFTGDLHAVGAAHNLLAALIDNHIYQGNELGLDPRRITWTRVLDMNDRSLRHVVIGLGGALEGVPREAGYEITAASEIMAVLCLSLSYQELRERIAAILVGLTYDRQPVRVADLKAENAVAALLRDALKPNLVQTLEGCPAFIHGGPFANIAHGTNSLLATRMGLQTSDYVVTEAGFGFDLGAEKYFHIVCPRAGFTPALVVLVVTARALRWHGGADGRAPDPQAVRRGMANLHKHMENVALFAVPLVVAINRFAGDTEEELDLIRAAVQAAGAEAVVTDARDRGGAGARDLARAVIKATARPPAPFRPVYQPEDDTLTKVRKVATRIYGAGDISLSKKAMVRLETIRRLGLEHLPVCIAKTPKSLSHDPDERGRPRDFTLEIIDIQIATGAGFLIPVCGKIVRMPGLPRHPAALDITLNDDGTIEGLF